MEDYESVLLRVYVGELDKWEHRPVYEVIVLKAKEMGIIGATVLRGSMGYGANSQMHTTKILRLSDDLPVIIEIVDQEEKINSLLNALGKIIECSLVTTEKVKVHRYRPVKSVSE